MQNSLTTTTSTKAAPWRRNGNDAATPTKLLSVEAAEFVPKFNMNAAEFVPSFNAAAAEFVPSFAMRAAPTQQSNNCFICLDGYSDESSSDDEAAAKIATPPRKSTPVTQEPTCSKGDSNEPLKPTQVSPSVTAAPLASRPWRLAREKISKSDDDDDQEFCGLVTPLSTTTVSTEASCTTPSLPGSDASDQELSEDHNYNLSVKGLLQLRYSVDAMDGSEERLSAMEVSPEELSLTEEKTQTTAPVEKPRGSKKPADKSWRDRETRERSQTCPGEAFAALRSVPKLKQSEDSWAAKQLARRNTKVADGQHSLTDEQVVRAMKSILNKLTIEKFSSLSRQLCSCGIRTTYHLETLIQEVFEKATTQHHFISMYADLCTVLHSHFSECPVTDDPKMNFKKVLLNACQASFERHLAPPADLDSLDDEARPIAEQRYKMRMLGNIRFVGALLVRKMLATKVMFAIIEELLSEPTPEAMESLASLLHVVGPVFDVPDWPHRTILNAVFAQVGVIITQPKLKSRVRCLLKDVMDHRATNWEDKKPKRQEAPSTLDEVAQKLAAEEGAAWTTPGSPVTGGGVRRISTRLPASPGGYGSSKAAYSNGYGNGYSSGNGYSGKWGAAATGNGENASALNIDKLASDLFRKVADKESGAPRDSLQTSKLTSEQPKKRKEIASEERFDKDACRRAIAGALTELRVSRDVKEAIRRLIGIAVPFSQQPEELCDLLAQVAEEGSEEVRKIGFQFAASLFTEGHWKPGALSKGLESFMGDTCADLKCDVPTLPKIVHEELYPAFAALVKNGLLPSAHHELLMATV